MKFPRPVPAISALLLLWSCSSSPFVKVPPHPAVCLVEPNLEPHDKAPVNELDLLLRYHGIAPGDSGTAPERTKQFLSASEIKDILESLGFTTFAFPGVLDGEAVTSLQHHLDLGRPLLVLLKSPLDDVFWNFLVGYTDETSLLIMQGPDRKLRGLPRDLFSSWWDAADNLTILAVPDTTLPMEN